MGLLPFDMVGTCLGTVRTAKGLCGGIQGDQAFCPDGR